MSSKKCGTKPRGSLYVQKINLNDNDRKPRRMPPKLCLNCEETNEYVKLLSSRVNRIEEIVDNFYKNI